MFFFFFFLFLAALSYSFRANTVPHKNIIMQELCRE